MRFVQPLNPRSLSGAPLDIWNRKVRLVYLDEAGVGSLKDEPYLVIAGAILNADVDWRPLQRHIKSLRRKYLPSEHQDDFVFHAKDILHGTGYFKEHRNKWPRDKRLAILSDLAAMPRLFQLPVVHVGVDRAATAKWIQAQHLRPDTYRDAYGTVRLPPPPPLSDSALATLTHLGAWARCARVIDNWMDSRAKNEVAMFVAENPGKIQRHLKNVHSQYSNDERYAEWKFTTNYIVDTVTFADKHESILLQIADVCAFLVKRRLQRKENTQSFFGELEKQLINPLSSANDDVQGQRAPPRTQLRRYSGDRFE